MDETVMNIVNTYVIPIVTYLATSGVLTAILVAVFKAVIGRVAARKQVADKDIDDRILSAVKGALSTVAGSEIDFDITSCVDAELQKLTAGNVEQNKIIMENIQAMRQIVLDMALHMSNSRTMKPEEREIMLHHIEQFAGLRSAFQEAKKLKIDLKPEAEKLAAQGAPQGAETAKNAETMAIL